LLALSKNSKFIFIEKAGSTWNSRFRAKVFLEFQEG